MTRQMIIKQFVKLGTKLQQTNKRPILYEN